MKRRMTVAALLMLLPAACHRDQPSGTLSADESRQLNDAAAMLDANANSTAPIAEEPDNGDAADDATANQN